MHLTIDATRINAFLDSKNIQSQTKDVYKSVLENLETFALNFPNEEQAVILNRFVNQNDLKPKARMMYNSVVNMYLNYISTMENIPSVQIVQPVQAEIKNLPREVKPKAVFVPQEIDFTNLCHFDDTLFFVENCEEYHQISDEMDKAELALLSGENFCLRGKAGTGKTSLAIALAKKHNMPVVKIACNDGVKDYHLIGSKSIDSKTDLPKHEAGLFMQAVLLANKYGVCEVILDEVNTLKPTTMKVINPFMDKTRFLHVNGYGKLKLNEGAKLFVFGTMNLNYAGTNDLNPEFKGRMTMGDIQDIPRSMQTMILSRYNVDDQIVQKIIDMTEQINHLQKINEIDPLTVFSTREQLATLNMIEAGLNAGMDKSKVIKMALSVNFTGKLYESDQQKKVEGIIYNVFLGCI